MPRISLDTNLPASKIPEGFLAGCTGVLAKTLSKQSKYCIATVNPSIKMTFGGTDEPCGLIQVTSIGSLGSEENKKHIAAITDYIHGITGIAKNKLIVQFQSNMPESTGFMGTTFHQLYCIEKGARL